MMRIIENIYHSVKKLVRHKLLLIQYILPIKPENLSVIIHAEEKVNKNNLDFFKPLETMRKDKEVTHAL